jgi:hypothetical protein
VAEISEEQAEKMIEAARKQAEEAAKMEARQRQGELRRGEK